MKRLNIFFFLTLLIIISGCSKNIDGPVPIPLDMMPTHEVERIMVDDTQINPVTYWWVDENSQKIEFYAWDGLEIIEASEDKNEVITSLDGKTLTGEHVDYAIDGEGGLTITIKPCGTEEMHYYDFMLLYNKKEYKYRISQSSRANQEKLAEILRKNPLKGAANIIE